MDLAKDDRPDFAAATPEYEAEMQQFWAVSRKSIAPATFLFDVNLQSA
jgi:hypothetical protein